MIKLYILTILKEQITCNRHSVEREGCFEISVLRGLDLRESGGGRRTENVA
jgi:hypothetical protein